MTTVQHINLVQNGRRKGTQRNAGDIGKFYLVDLLQNIYYLIYFMISLQICILLKSLVRQIK